MTARVLVIGGYGNFGSFISRTLARDDGIQVIVAGRSHDRARRFCEGIAGAAHRPLPAQLDISRGFDKDLPALSPDIVIHTSGPFQGQDYGVARACIAANCHYIDLADGREFVNGIGALHDDAERSGVFVTSGGSSVPCLTAALIDRYRGEFALLDTVDYGIATAQRTNRGLATTAAILSYGGRPFTTTVDGRTATLHGWQGLRRHRYRALGGRWLCDCDIPDLALFPRRYPELRTIRFGAGLEVPLLHLGLWMLSWVVRAGLVRRLDRWAKPMLGAARLFDGLGSADSAFHMELSGEMVGGSRRTVSFELVAHGGDGPYIPCMPAIIIARKLARSAIPTKGAYPCIGFLTLDEYLDALAPLDIAWDVR